MVGPLYYQQQGPSQQAHNVVSTLFLGWILVMTLNNVEPTLFQRQIFTV